MAGIVEVDSDDTVVGSCLGATGGAGGGYVQAPVACGVLVVGRGGGWGSRGGRRRCLAAASRHALAMLQPESRPAASRRSHGGRRAAAVSCCGWGRAAAGLKLAGAWATEASSGGRGERGGGGGRVRNWIGMEDFLRIEMGQPRNNLLELGAHLGQQRGRLHFGAPKAFTRARSSGLCAGKARKSAPDGRHRRERLQHGPAATSGMLLHF
jgi:hypothetical protein